jgi:hypothetical protein
MNARSAPHARQWSRSPDRDARALRKVSMTGMCAAFIACSAATLAWPAEIATPVTGPDKPDEAGYAYFSLPEAKQAGGSTQYYNLHYEVCNRHGDRGLAFAWNEPGFGMDVNSPLPAGKCAVFARGAAGYELAPNATLRLSEGSHPASAYIPCDKRDTNGKCEVSSSASGLSEWMTEFQTFLSPPASLNSPTSVVTPLRVLVRTDRKGRSTEIQASWEGKGIEFVLGFPGVKSDPHVLQRSAIAKDGGDFEFDTFASYAETNKIAEDFLAPKGSNFAIVAIDPGKVSDQFGKGEWRIEFSDDAPMPGSAVLIILARGTKKRIIARCPVQLPPRVR